MARALLGFTREIYVGSAFMRRAGEAGVLVDRRHSMGVGSYAMRAATKAGVQATVVQEEISEPDMGIEASATPTVEASAEVIAVEADEAMIAELELAAFIGDQMVSAR